MAKIKSQVIALVKRVEQGEHSSIADGSENLYNHSENHFNSFSEICE